MHYTTHFLDVKQSPVNAERFLARRCESEKSNLTGICKIYKHPGWQSQRPRAPSHAMRLCNAKMHSYTIDTMAQLRVKQVLKRKGISQRRFAVMIGVEYRNVFRMIREDADPKLSTLQKWAKLLGVKISSLYTEDRR